jgi:polynucleotide 5'-hydroxyl-kinase GRC3/NOL9
LADPSLHVPPEWIEAAEHVRRRDARKVLVIGGQNAGKSTFCRCLVDGNLQTGRTTALLDTDVGQKIIGPPACVTMVDSRGLSLAFVGTTNPVLGWRRLIDGTRRLARQSDADCLIVNTSGLLAGPGRRLKAAKIQELQPDLVIALGEGTALEAVASDWPALTVLRLPSSPRARRKTEGERRALRREAFRHYFETGAMLDLAREQIPSPEADAPLPAGLLLGLSDGQGNDLGLGLLIGCSGDTVLDVLAPVERTKIARITPGSIRLDENFSETAMPAKPPHP